MSNYRWEQFVLGTMLLARSLSAFSQVGDLRYNAALEKLLESIRPAVRAGLTPEGKFSFEELELADLLIQLITYAHANDLHVTGAVRARYEQYLARLAPLAERNT